MSHADSFIIKISISYMHRLTASIVYVSNPFQYTNVLIYERVCVSSPLYYLDFFERSYPNVPLNWYKYQFCLKYVDVIQVTNLDVRQWNRLLDAVVKILKYKKITIYYAIYIKVFFDGTVSYLTVSTDDFLNTTNN